MPKEAVVLLVVGMAGSGKTTFMQRLHSWIAEDGKADYVINLDPAVLDLPYDCNIDIRETINYEQVMEQYQLGPNGAILTSLNLFTTKFDQVLDLIEKKKDQVDFIIVDTPGQIEIFTWSASGSIITDSLALSHPTIVLYIVDTPRCASPTTFMSNMLYACSILYKTRLPFVVLFNKTDVKDCQFAINWMNDFEALQQSISENDATYMSSLVSSMSLLLEEFYHCLSVVGVSAVTGDGKSEFFSAVSKAEVEYNEDYKKELEAVAQQRLEREKARQAKDISGFVQDMKLDREGSIILERSDASNTL